MRGFRVYCFDGSRIEFEGTRYEVNDAGELSIWGESERIQSLAAGSWVEIRSIGRPLSDKWPDPRTPRVMDNISNLLIVRYGGWLRGLDDERLSNWRLNDFDAFLDAVLEAATLDPKSTYDIPRIGQVRQIIADGYEVRLPRDRRYEQRFRR